MDLVVIFGLSSSNLYHLKGLIKSYFSLRHIQIWLKHFTTSWALTHAKHRHKHMRIKKPERTNMCFGLKYKRVIDCMVLLLGNGRDNDVRIVWFYSNTIRWGWFFFLQERYKNVNLLLSEAFKKINISLVESCCF